MAFLWQLVTLLVASAAEETETCATLSGLEALTCRWKEESQRCIQQRCQDCSGDQCLMCQTDSKLIHACCRENSQQSPQPFLCKSAELAQSIKTCFDTSCNGCLGQQCQECQKEESTISKCCEGDFHNVELPEICRSQVSSPCSDLSGEEGLSCSWAEEVRSCMKTFCKCDSDDVTDECKLCRENSAQVSSCCDQHRQSTQPPRICTDAILTQDVMSCIDQACASCASDQACKECKEDVDLTNKCCIDHRHGLEPPPMCQHVQFPTDIVP